MLWLWACGLGVGGGLEGRRRAAVGWTLLDECSLALGGVEKEQTEILI